MRDCNSIVEVKAARPLKAKTLIFILRDIPKAIGILKC